MSSNSSGAGRRPDDVQRLPSFFLVGPPRTGTSWLHTVLGGHAILPRTKETRFFDIHYHRGLEWYLAHFSAAPATKAVGEIAPTYFASANARERIARAIPSAKIVCTFRDPVERIVSLYRLKRAYGMIPWEFEDAIVRDPELIESGRYATNLKAWREAFGPKQVLATVYDELRRAPQTYVDALTDFLEMPSFPLDKSHSVAVHATCSMTEPRSYLRTRSATMMADWFKARRMHRVVSTIKKSPLVKLFLGGGPAFSEISQDVLMSIYELFRPEIEELEELLHRDLSAWKPTVQCARL